MWFTIAFITYPIAFYLTYKAFKNYKTHRIKNLLIASLIFIVPIILLLIERHNLKEINSNLEGIYVSGFDSLFITNNEFILKETIEKKIGKWELMTYDNLGIILTDEQNKTNELKIIYENGKSILTDGKRSYTKLN
jgi:hypothetical protein